MTPTAPPPEARADRDTRALLRQTGRLDLGIWIETVLGEQLWSIQREIATELSRPMAHVAVPSCFGSGKSYIAARLAIAFFDTYTPGSACEPCGGKCGGSKIITTSSKWEQLRDVLWSELRVSHKKARARGLGVPGRLFPGDLRVLDISHDGHYIIGHSPREAEGFQGYHAAHVLVIGDEATAVSEEVAKGIRGVLAAGDARLLLIFNPTDSSSYAAQVCRNGRAKVIRIRAWDTPFFTKEPMPAGANLITQEFLDDLKRAGMGPGTYEWQTKVEAEFWEAGENTLIPGGLYIAARERIPTRDVRQLGIDMAAYGDDENTIVLRDGNAVAHLEAHPAMRQDEFWQGPVLKAVRRFKPHYIVYDADGVGAGVSGEADRVARVAQVENPDFQHVLGFRANLSKGLTQYRNQRAAWFWHLRRRFEAGKIAVMIEDLKLMEQLTALQYVFKDGKIQVEPKHEYKKRMGGSPDRADGVMYSFAFSDDLEIPVLQQDFVERITGVVDASEAAMWARMLDGRDHQPEFELDPVTGSPLDW